MDPESEQLIEDIYFLVVLFGFTIMILVILVILI